MPRSYLVTISRVETDDLKCENHTLSTPCPHPGVLEAVRISCAGFPSKRPYPDFVDHFWTLAPSLLRQPDLSDREISRRILDKTGITGYQLGTTKVRRSVQRGCELKRM